MRWQTAPLVADKRSIPSSGKPGSCRIEMNVIRHNPEIIGIRIRSVYRHRLVAALEDMPLPQPRPVPPLTERAHQVFHPRNQIGLRRFQQQVEVVAHEHPSVNPPSMAFTNLCESEHKRLPVVVRLKNNLAAITTRHHMVNRPGILESCRSCHALAYSITHSNTSRM